MIRRFLSEQKEDVPKTIAALMDKYPLGGSNTAEARASPSNGGFWGRLGGLFGRQPLNESDPIPDPAICPPIPDTAQANLLLRNNNNNRATAGPGSGSASRGIGIAGPRPPVLLGGGNGGGSVSGSGDSNGGVVDAAAKNNAGSSR